tara:strand:- start:909 stop:1652 length:744 start_codon:yes stop_codon:yes gene_type:complete
VSIFGAISDVFESAGDVLLGQAGGGARTRSVLGGIGSLATGTPDAYLAARTSPTLQTASGREGQVATAVPQQGPVETSYSSVYNPSNPFNINRRRVGTQVSIPRNFPPNVGTAMMDIIPDISISKFFGNGMPNICGTQMKKPYSINAKTGCLSVTRKQQKMLRDMLMFRTLDEASASVGLTKDEYTALVIKQFPARRRGITASQLRNAKRVNNQIIRMHDQLASAFKTTTARRSTKAAGTRVTQIKN